ncbi:hypothetical protein Tco_0369365, partial [Tanacetum coccineum]
IKEVEWWWRDDGGSSGVEMVVFGCGVAAAGGVDGVDGGSGGVMEVVGDVRQRRGWLLWCRW